jgi:hypothetical protein
MKKQCPKRYTLKNCALTHRGGLRVKRLHKGHREIAEKGSHYFKIASILLKMYLKSLAILEKASIFLKKSSKIIEIFIKALHF